MFDVHQHFLVLVQDTSNRRAGEHFVLSLILPDGKQTLWTGAYLLAVLSHSGETQVNEAFGASTGFVLHAESEREFT